MISTDAGMIAYRSDAAEPQEQLARTNVRVYPNPFRPTLQREVSLDGLTADADVRVTTTRGHSSMPDAVKADSLDGTDATAAAEWWLRVYIISIFPMPTVHAVLPQKWR